MRVVIPVAGRGTRLLPHTTKRQKCLLPVAGKPVIDHILAPLMRQGFRDIVLVTGYLEEQLRRHVRGFNASFAFVRQAEALGLGHAVFQGLEYSHEPVLIQLGDTIYHHDLARFCATEDHRIAIDEVPDPERFGIVETDGESIVKVLEKPAHPPTHLAIIGLYYMASQKPLWEAIKYLMDQNLTTRGEIQLADAFQIMIDAGETIRHEKVTEWYDCGVPETFLSTNRALLRTSGMTFEDSTVVEPVSIGSDCTISKAKIGPHVTVMDGCHISDSEISDAIVLWNARIDGERIRHAIVEEDYSS